jgi:hypothetical protein
MKGCANSRLHETSQTGARLSYDALHYEGLWSAASSRRFSEATCRRQTHALAASHLLLSAAGSLAAHLGTKLSQKFPAVSFHMPMLRLRQARSLFDCFIFISICAASLFSVSAATAPDFPEAEVNLMPAYGEIPPTFWEQNGNTILIASAVIILCGIGLIFWLLRPKSTEAIPPDKRAINALGPLLNRPEDGALLTEITHVLRQYFVSAFHLTGNEATTTEFCRMLSSSELVGQELSSDVGSFLRACDERKFAPSAAAVPMSAAATALELVKRGEQRRIAIQPGQPSLTRA